MHLTSNIVNLRQYKFNEDNKKYAQHAAKTARKYGLLHGGPLSIFRYVIANDELMLESRIAWINVGKEQDSFHPILSHAFLRNARQNDIHLSCVHPEDTTPRIFEFSIQENGELYLAVFKTNDDKDKVAQFLIEMSRFISKHQAAVAS